MHPASSQVRHNQYIAHLEWVTLQTSLQRDFIMMPCESCIILYKQNMKIETYLFVKSTIYKSLSLWLICKMDERTADEHWHGGVLPDILQAKWPPLSAALSCSGMRSGWIRIQPVPQTHHWPIKARTSTKGITGTKYRGGGGEDMSADVQNQKNL